MPETPSLEIVRSLVASAEREHPGNDWWGVRVARRHLEALVAEVERLRLAADEAADRIAGDDRQIHDEWGVGPYEPDPWIEELRALARGEAKP